MKPIIFLFEMLVSVSLMAQTDNPGNKINTV
jgi:hypothetical protein